VNCPQHITRRFSENDLAPMIADYQRRIRQLEAEVERLNAASRPS